MLNCVKHIDSITKSCLLKNCKMDIKLYQQYLKVRFSVKNTNRDRQYDIPV